MSLICLLYLWSDLQAVVMRVVRWLVAPPIIAFLEIDWWIRGDSGCSLVVS